MIMEVAPVGPPLRHDHDRPVVRSAASSTESQVIGFRARFASGSMGAGGIITGRVRHCVSLPPAPFGGRGAD
jgi:hypothetical protein